MFEPMKSVIRTLLAVVVVSSTASCSILGPLFGFDRTQDVSVYRSAMADYSACETAPNPSDRAAAAARLSAAAGSMSSVSRPSNPDHFYEMDRVVAANERCQEALSAR